MIDPALTDTYIVRPVDYNEANVYLRYRAILEVVIEPFIQEHDIDARYFRMVTHVNLTGELATLLALQLPNDFRLLRYG